MSERLLEAFIRPPPGTREYLVRWRREHSYHSAYGRSRLVQRRSVHAVREAHAALG